MKYYINNATLIIITALLMFWPSAARADVEKMPSGEKIIVEMKTLPINIKPGEKPITLSGNLLKKLFPELNNPRLMSLNDLNTSYQEQEDFIEEGFTFVLRGDFNRDGVADIAFAGKYDNPQRPNENSFIGIISIKDKKVIRVFYALIYKEKVSLIRVINYKPKLDAIGMSYTIPSEDCGYLFWDGQAWYYDDKYKK